VKNVYKNIVGKEALANFLAETNILKKCDHPGIVRFNEIYEDEETYYLVQELLEGEELGQFL
jgi:serine/threonine protein kinase